MKCLLGALSAIYISLCLIAGSASAQTVDREAENMVLTAVDKLESRDYAGARQLLCSVLEQDEHNDAAWYYLSKVALAENDLELAETCLKTATTIDPDNFWYRYNIASIYSYTRRPELAIDMYEKLLEDFPKRSELYFDLVEFYASQREYQKALDMIDEIEKVFGMTESMAVYRFNLLRVMDRQVEAYESLKKYNQRYSSPFVLSTLADYEMSMYNDSTALSYYNEALEIASDYAPAMLGKAETYRVTRRYADYFNELYHYVEMPEIPVASKSEYLVAVFQQVDSKFRKSFQSQLDTTIVKMLGAHPGDSTAIQTAAVYYYSTGRNDKAKEKFLENVTLYPESLSASADYVEFLMYANQWEDLSREGRAAFDRFPHIPDFLEMAGIGDYNLQDYDKLLKACYTILEVAPTDSSKTLRTWSTIGDVYYQQGESKKAFKAYDRALKVNPDYVYVLNNYAYYLSEEGKKLKKALEMSRKTIEAEPDNATYLDTYAWILFHQGKPAEAKPHLKHAMLYGGKESAVILDHYAEVLFALKEYDMAFIYWNMALRKNDGDVPDLEEKIRKRKEEAGR